MSSQKHPLINFLRRPYNGRTIALLVGIFVLIVFNFSQHTGPTDAQRAFDGVVKDIERPLDGIEEELGGEAEVALHSDLRGNQFKWSVSTANKGEQQLVTRVMQLLREAMLPQLREVAADEPYPTPSSEEIVVGVTKGPHEGPKRKFVAVLKHDDVSHNIQIQNLIKLVQIQKQ